MPVSFCPANFPADPIKPPGQISPTTLLSFILPHRHKKTHEILHSSFGDRSIITSGTSSRAVVHQPCKDGLVGTVIRAYSNHHALILRPDDVWLAILTQFSFLVNGNAESLRSHFVSHQGKKKLVLDAVGDRYTVDYGHMARTMTTLLQENVSDTTFCDWILPDFSTTTLTDTTVAAILTMATLKSYFTYGLRLRCGIPRVTLEGEKADWQKILERLDRLKTYGLHAIAWYHLLVPVVSRLVSAFDDPDGRLNVEFWQKVAHRENMGSGPTWLSGWITAFCAFSEEGDWLGVHLNQDIDPSINLSSFSTQEFWSIVTTQPTSEPCLVLDGTSYHTIDTKKIPIGCAEVEVELDDNGTSYSTVLTAGLVGSTIDSSGDTNLSPLGENDSLRPIAGWWMFIPL